MTVVEATEQALAAAGHLDDRDAGAVATLRRLAGLIDVIGERPADNVTIPTYLKFCESLGLTPTGRLKLTLKEGPRGKLADLRAIRNPA